MLLVPFMNCPCAVTVADNVVGYKYLPAALLFSLANRQRDQLNHASPLPHKSKDSPAHFMPAYPLPLLVRGSP
jgi:hypothetical protein